MVNVNYLFACILLFGVSAFANANVHSYRLSNKILPLAYDIWIKAYLLPEDGERQFTFDGVAHIQIGAQEDDLQEVIFHMRDITIKYAEIISNNSQTIHPLNSSSWVYDPDTDQLRIRLPEPLSKSSNSWLHFVYKGRIGTQPPGLFHTRQIDSEGNPRWLAVTRLQCTGARTLFPSFDEPAFKARYLMHIDRPWHYNAFFNTRLLKSEPQGEQRTIDHFVQTPPMASYLLAIVLSQMARRDSEEQPIIVDETHRNHIGYASNVAMKSLILLDEFTHLPYRSFAEPLIQHVAYPDLPFQAMAHWGLILYKESAITHVPNYNDGWLNKQATLKIIIHSMVHLWFGNIVTAEWWSHSWLHEAFASYNQHFLAHKISPEFQLDQQFTVNFMHAILETDALYSAEPLVGPTKVIQSEGEFGMQGAISDRNKGACLLRMYRTAMGKRAFNKAIVDFLHEYQQGSFKTADFYKHLKLHWPKHHDLNLDRFFFDWTELAGYPVLNVTISNDGYSIVIKQRRFLLREQDEKFSEIIHHVYTIPITYTTSVEKDFDNLKPNFYFNQSEPSLSWHFKRQVRWVIFNLQQVNFYRVFYDPRTMETLRSTLMEPGMGGIHVLNRAQLVNDMLAFGRMGALSYYTVFHFLEYLATEMEYLPWQAAFNGFEYIAPRLSYKMQTRFANFLFNISNRIYRTIDVHTDSADTMFDIYKRNLILIWWSRYKHIDSISYCVKAFENSIRTREPLPPDIRAIVYCNAMRDTEFRYYYTLEQMYDMEHYDPERQLLLRSMGCTTNFVKYHYHRILSKNIPLQHKLIAFEPLYKENPQNVMFVFSMVSQTIESFAKALGGWKEAANAISDLAELFNTRAQVDQFRQFINRRLPLFGGSSEILLATLRRVEQNVRFADSQFNDLYRYLNERSHARRVRGSKMMLFGELLILAISSHLMCTKFIVLLPNKNIKSK